MLLSLFFLPIFCFEGFVLCIVVVLYSSMCVERLVRINQKFPSGTLYYKGCCFFLQENFLVCFVEDNFSNLCYSLLNDSTGSFLLANLAGIHPPIKVRITLIVINNKA